MPSHELNDEALVGAVLRFSGKILGLSLGVITGLIIFVATNWLVIKGGDVVGSHLQLLSEYFIGYSVTFAGSFVGMVYGFVMGYLAGLIIAWIYNGIVALKGK